jgi:ATP-binding cassette subfamily A (ABC1) protein 8
MLMVTAFILCRLLILVVGICPFLFENISTKIRQSSYTWELSPHDYFLAPGQQPQGMLTQLLIINKTGNNGFPIHTCIYVSF